MTRRLPSLFGERLRDARLARGLTAVALSERVGVTPAAVSQYESGTSEPRAPTLERLEKELDLPQSYFLRPPQPSGSPLCFFRSLASSTKRARQGVQVKLRWIEEIVAFLAELVQLPPVNLPSCQVPEDPSALRAEEIEESAAHVRTSWAIGSGPISNIVDLLESNGIIISRFSFNTEDLDGFSVISADRPFIVLNADKHVAVRSRFDAAHELGHLILHAKISPQSAGRLETHKLLETQAHRFAASFLFPAKAFCDEVYSISPDALISIKRRWLVSIQMVVRRAHDLGLVSKDQYERAFQSLSRRGYRRAEPLDDEIPVERPQVLRRSLELLVNESVMTLDDLLYKLPFSRTDIELLAHTQRGFLTDKPVGQLVKLRPKDGSGSAPPPNISSATIIPFPRNNGS